MKRLLPVLILALFCSAATWAQQTGADAPASKEDVQRYLDVMHSREMMSQIVDAMAKPMHQMIHEEYLKSKDTLPADFEARMDKMEDDMMKSFPWDEMLQSMVPVYQKHLTKGEIDALVAFYSAPTGQKLLREMPAITAEAMETMMPILRKQLDAMNDRIQEQVAQMLKDSKAKPGEKPQPSPN
jgi:uncharacterized protein